MFLSLIFDDDVEDDNFIFDYASSSIGVYEDFNSRVFRLIVSEMIRHGDDYVSNFFISVNLFMIILFVSIFRILFDDT